jgi:hypothetical protein
MAPIRRGSCVLLGISVQRPGRPRFTALVRVLDRQWRGIEVPSLTRRLIIYQPEELG